MTFTFPVVWVIEASPWLFYKGFEVTDKQTVHTKPVIINHPVFTEKEKFGLGEN